jgi:hypothetical protein
MGSFFQLMFIYINLYTSFLPVLCQEVCFKAALLGLDNLPRLQNAMKKSRRESKLSHILKYLTNPWNDLRRKPRGWIEEACSLLSRILPAMPLTCPLANTECLIHLNTLYNFCALTSLAVLFRATTELQRNSRKAQC